MFKDFYTVTRHQIRRTLVLQGLTLPICLRETFVGILELRRNAKPCGHCRLIVPLLCFILRGSVFNTYTVTRRFRMCCHYDIHWVNTFDPLKMLEVRPGLNDF